MARRVMMAPRLAFDPEQVTCPEGQVHYRGVLQWMCRQCPVEPDSPFLSPESEEVEKVLVHYTFSR